MKKLVLLAEDNSDDILLTKRAFKKSNVSNEIIVVNNGQEALDFLFYEGRFKNRDKNQTPELILLDLKMPEIDGLEVLKKIRENEFTKHLPVVILTTSEEENDMMKCYCLGANSYIIKPVDYDQFIEVVKQLSTYWLILNQRPNIDKCCDKFA